MKVLGIKSNFLGLENEHSSLAGSRVVILPAPYERTVSYGTGTKNGPAELLRASHQVEFYDEETRREVYSELGIATAAPLDFGSRSDEAALDHLYTAAKKLLDGGKFVVTLGG